MHLLTRSCFPPLLVGRFYLIALPLFFGTCLPSLCEAHPFLPCSRSDLPLSHHGAALAHLDSFPPHHLMIRADGSVPLAKAFLAYLPTAHFVALRPFYSLRKAQFVPVFPPKSALFYKLSRDLGSTNKSAFLLFPDGCSVLSFVVSFTSNSLVHFAGAVFSFLLFYPATTGPWIISLPSNNAAEELARQGAQPLLSAIPCSLLSLVLTLLFFSDWKRTVSPKFFDVQVPSVSTEELMLPRHACCVLSRLRCNGHSLLLNSYLPRIGRIKNRSYGPSTIRPRTPLISFCTV